MTYYFCSSQTEQPPFLMGSCVRERAFQDDHILGNVKQELLRCAAVLSGLRNAKGLNEHSEGTPSQRGNPRVGRNCTLTCYQRYAQRVDHRLAGWRLCNMRGMRIPSCFAQGDVYINIYKCGKLGASRPGRRARSLSTTKNLIFLSVKDIVQLKNAPRRSRRPSGCDIMFCMYIHVYICGSWMDVHEFVVMISTREMVGCCGRNDYFF